MFSWAFVYHTKNIIFLGVERYIIYCHSLIRISQKHSGVVTVFRLTDKFFSKIPIAIVSSHSRHWRKLCRSPTSQYLTVINSSTVIQCWNQYAMTAPYLYNRASLLRASDYIELSTEVLRSYLLFILTPWNRNATRTDVNKNLHVTQTISA